jgi:hypothetical protein
MCVGIAVLSAMVRPDVASGEGYPFSPDFKTRATKTKTKTV